MTSSVRADGTPDLVTSAAGKALVVDDHKVLLDELQGILTVSLVLFLLLRLLAKRRKSAAMMIESLKGKANGVNAL